MPLIYADGSALSRALTPGPEAGPWLRWAHENRDRLVTSPLALTELRRVADPLGPVARDQAARIASEATVLRFSDQAVGTAALTSAVLDPFQSLHLGICVAEREVEGLATYDRALARVAAIHEVSVISPGKPPTWYR